MTPVDPYEHRWLGLSLRAGIWRGACTCGERFSSSDQNGPYKAFTAHLDAIEIVEVEQ